MNVVSLDRHRKSVNADALARDLEPMVPQIVNLIMRHKLTEAQAVQVFATLAQNAHRGIRPLLEPT